MSFSTIFAYDDASDSAYDGGFLQYSNGGFGFDVWDYGTSNNSDPNPMFLGSSNSNGGGGGPGIDTGGRSWGVSYPVIGGSYIARFLSAPMPTGATYSCLWDTGSLAQGTHYETGLYGDTIGFFFVDVSSSQPRYHVQFSEVVGKLDTGIAWTDGGLKVSLTLLAANGDEFDYRFELEALATSQTFTYTGTTYNAGGFAPNYADFWGRIARNAPSGDYFVNEMKIESVPEPSGLLVLTLGLGAFRRRRRG